ncbi:MAG: SDR family oxidoreductase [Desulfobacteraceae bacterium]|nr:SDR family oxidoreductase [Desulfobacteraceae bacterium]
MELNGKTAIVLGGIKGIGKAIGLALARRGVLLGLTYYDWEEHLDAMRNDFAATGTEHMIERVNLLETEAVPSFVNRVADRFGGIDILINNIERGGWPVVHGRYTRRQWDLEMGTTLRAKQWMFEAALPYLKQGGDGCVINFSSIAGLVGRSGPASFIFNEGYSAANRGVSLLTETWARLAAPEVRVNELMLGIFEARHANGTRGWELLSEEQRQEVIDHTLAGRVGSLDDVVRAVLFIIKDAPYMTGSVLRLDGGYVLGGDRAGPMPEGVE